MKHHSPKRLMLISGLFMMILMMVGCSIPKDNQNGLLGSGAEKQSIPATPFLEGEEINYEDDTLLLREVNAENGSEIDQILVSMSPKLARLSLKINGVEAQLSQQGDDYLIQVQNPASIVLLELTDEIGVVIKKCKIDLETILTPEGDCVW